MNAKTSARVRELRLERKRLLGELSALRLLLRGTLFERYSLCARRDCGCRRGKRHGPRTYLAVTQAKRQRQHYVPQDQVASVRRGVEQYHRLLARLDRITRINLELMRGGQLNEEKDPGTVGTAGAAYRFGTSAAQ